MIDSFKFEYIEHIAEGHKVIYCIHSNYPEDEYAAAMRKGPVGLDNFHQYVWRANHLERPLRLADFGSNIGGVSLPAAALGFKVLAVEAHPRNVAALAEAIIANGFTNITLVNAAAHKEPSLIRLQGNSAWAGVDVQGNNLDGPQVYSNSITKILKLYNFLDVDIVKIDIEGSELAALTDIEELVDLNKGVEFIFESNSYVSRLFGYTTYDLLSRFWGLGFNLFVLRGARVAPLEVGEIHFGVLEDILATRRSLREVEMLGKRHFERFSDEEIIENLEARLTIDDISHLISCLEQLTRSRHCRPKVFEWLSINVGSNLDLGPVIAGSSNNIDLFFKMENDHLSPCVGLTAEQALNLGEWLVRQAKARGASS